MIKSSWARGLLLAGAVFVATMPATEMQAAKATKAPSKGGGSVASYDGLWSVLIITEQGTCDRGYRYAVRIKNGGVGHADPSNSSFRIGGRVNAGGAINVSVARGTQSANGSGRISRNGGTGRWKSSKGECSGTWQAERRGS
ncbi:MAG: hypothetical protein ABWY35_07455 [Pseudorhodoplanes sp.]